MNNPEPNELLDGLQDRERQADIEMLRARLHSINLQKAGLEKEAQAIRRRLAITEKQAA